jgi:hypothetical protein
VKIVGLDWFVIVYLWNKHTYARQPLWYSTGKSVWRSYAEFILSPLSWQWKSNLNSSHVSSRKIMNDIEKNCIWPSKCNSKPSEWSVQTSQRFVSVLVTLTQQLCDLFLNWRKSYANIYVIKEINGIVHNFKCDITDLKREMILAWCNSGSVTNLRKIWCDDLCTKIGNDIRTF